MYKFNFFISLKELDYAKNYFVITDWEYMDVNKSMYFLVLIGILDSIDSGLVDIMSNLKALLNTMGTLSIFFFFLP